MVYVLYVKFITSPNAMHISCRTSVKATEYKPPSNVYKMAMNAETITEYTCFKPTITVRLAPANIFVLTIRYV